MWISEMTGLSENYNKFRNGVSEQKSKSNSNRAEINKFELKTVKISTDIPISDIFAVFGASINLYHRFQQANFCHVLNEPLRSSKCSNWLTLQDSFESLKPVYFCTNFEQNFT